MTPQHPSWEHLVRNAQRGPSMKTMLMMSEAWLQREVMRLLCLNIVFEYCVVIV
jgi:hypothetical protein